MCYTSNMNLAYFHCGPCDITRCIAEHQLGISEPLHPWCPLCNCVMIRVRLEDLGKLPTPPDPNKLSSGFKSLLNSYAGIRKHKDVDLLERCLSIS